MKSLDLLTCYQVVYKSMTYEFELQRILLTGATIENNNR